MLSWPDYLSQRAGKVVQYFAAPGARHTVLICSHVWWTEQIALAILNAGFNVVVHYPFYLLYTDNIAFNRFDELWKQFLGTIRQAKVDVILGGNTGAMLVHPKTGEMLQDAAGAAEKRKVTLVNWWWDEPRTKPPWAREDMGIAPNDYLRHLGNKNTINAIWDIDVKEELQKSYGLTNLFHLPLATLPEFWPDAYVPLENRTLPACFLGNCHFTADWATTDNAPLTQWARQIVLKKLADPRTPMQTCIDEITAAVGGIPHDSKVAGDAWLEFSWPTEVLNAVYMQYTRNSLVVAAQAHLKGSLALIGKGWEKLGLRANMDHAHDKSGMIYGQAQSSLNLFGGCVHGGLPLRPYDIGASGGLIVSHDQRELPAIFEPGKECLAFIGANDMLATLERVRAAPAEFNAVALAGRRRVLAEHTWGHRMRRLIKRIDDI